MITLTPNSTPVDISHALDILTLVVDPATSKQRLTDLQDALDRANLGIERAEKLQADVDQRLKLAAAAETNLDEDKATFAKLMQETDARHTATQASLTQQQADLDAKTAALTKSMSQRESDVTGREETVTALESTLTQRAADIAAKEADLARRLKLIQSAAA